MAFSANRDFAKGSQVVISLSLPGGNDSVRFRLKILRCVDEGHGGVLRYGGEYAGMPKEALERLKSFVYDR